VVPFQSVIPAYSVELELTSFKIPLYASVVVAFTCSGVPGEVVPIPTNPVPLGLRRMFPVPVGYVAELPRVRLWVFVVAMFPFPSMNVATLARVPAILAVGASVGELMFMNANLAEAVALTPAATPRRTS
jgi:hypothetical protein